MTAEEVAGAVERAIDDLRVRDAERDDDARIIDALKQRVSVNA